MPAAIRFGLREEWRDLKRGRPGHRFQDRYERARREERSGFAKRVATIGVAALVLAIGAFFAVVPGPAIPFLFFGGALLAAESRLIARLMDWIEVRARRVLAWARRHWRRLSLPARVAVVALMAASSASVGYLLFRVVRG